MPLHPALQPMCDAANQAMAASADGPPPSEDERLALLRTSAAVFGALGCGEPEAMHVVEEREADGPHGPIPVRVYRPAPDPGAPLVLYFHGGGFVSGTLDAWDGVCRRIAKEVGAVVVSVDYRLAPEHPFPIPLDDCVAALAWAVAHADELGGDAARVAVAGDSAGGNLAGAVALRALDDGPRLRAQVLVYPVVDPACATPSMAENGSGYLLTANAMREMWRWYLGHDGDESHPAAALEQAEPGPGLAPALVITAEYDPLRDEGERYARHLADHGVDTQVTRYDGMLHGFFGMREIVPESNQAIEEIGRFLRPRLT